MRRARAWARVIYRKARRRVGIKMLALAVKLWPDLWEAKVRTAAAMVARIHIDNYLVQQGIMHCNLCLNRFPLVKIDGKYYCGSHAQTITQVIQNKNGSHVAAATGA